MAEHKPWNGQTYDAFESMVTWLKKADGTWYFDYTVFDRWVEFMMSVGVRKQNGRASHEGHAGNIGGDSQS